ncbi:MAG: rhamnulokinase [Planctomycetales bacterium]
MSEKCYLAVDLGAESGRVIAGLFDGQKIRLEQVNRFSNGAVPFGETLRWDVLKLWSEIQSGIAQAAHQHKAITSVGVDTWGVDYALFGPEQEMLGNPYHYRDPRTQGTMQQVFAQVSRQEIFAATGLQFMEFNTLFQLFASQQKIPQILKQSRRFLMMADIFHWLLSGSQVVEFTNATTTQFFNPQAGTWAFDLLRKLGIPTEMFGDVVPPGTLLGKLRTNLADRLNLPRMNVVAPATHDTGSAVVACPTEQTGSARWAYISSGTWSLMGLEVPHAILTPEALKKNVTNEGGVDGTYRLLKNIMGLWLVQECRRSFERAGHPLDYAPLIKLAESAPPFKSLIDPDHHTLLAPKDMPTAIRELCKSTGQPVPQSEGELVRCALESLALKYRIVLEGLEELSGEKVEVIHVVGGGSQNELLNQFTADACGRPVIAGPVEATALGNVLIQARTAGDIGSLADIRKVVRASVELKTFLPRNPDAWEQALTRFREILAQPA